MKKEEQRRLILDGHKLNWHKERVEAWFRGEKIAPITIDCALTRRCNYNCIYCVASATKILMADFTWKQIKDIKVGDEIMGFDEKNGQKGKHLRARYFPTKVTQIMKRNARLHRLVSKTTNDRLFITKEHPVLCKGHRWRKPEQFREAEVRFFCTPYETSFKETYDYKLGYLKGLLEGDGTFGKYLDPTSKGLKNKRFYHKFKLDLTDKEPLDRVERYIQDLFSINVNLPNSQVITLNSNGIVEHIRSCIEWKEISKFKTLNFALGYLAGIFDAEGSLSGWALRISIKKDLNTVGVNIKNALLKCKFDYVKERDGFRIKGGFSEIARFFGQIKPAIKRKITKLYNARIPSTLQVTHDSKHSNADVYNLETENHTYIANGFCVHNCYSKLQVNDEKRMTRDVIFKFLDDAAEIGVKAVSFVSDGESTCSPHLYDAISYGKENGLDMALGTNGFLLKKEKLEEMLSALTYLRFNFSAGELKRYAEIMGCREKDFYKVIDIIKKCVKIKKEKNLDVTIGLQMVLMPAFKDQILPLARLGKDLGVDYTIIKHCSDDENGSLGIDYQKYFKKDLIDKLKKAESYSNDEYLVKVKWSKILSGGKRKYTKCYGPPFIVQFSGSGLVAPCGMFFNDKYKKFHIGNITEKSFKEIWQSDRYWEVMGLIASNEFDARTDCGTLCLQHKVNEYLWDLKQGKVKLEAPKGELPIGVNFV